MEDPFPGASSALRDTYNILAEAQKVASSLHYEDDMDDALSLRMDSSSAGSRQAAVIAPSPNPSNDKRDGSKDNGSSDDDGDDNREQEKIGQPAKTKKRTWKKPVGKPKRPLSAYNLFFQLERENIIKGIEDMPITSEVVASIAVVQQEKPKRRHRKTHGKVSFGDLARKIADKWKKLDNASKAIFERRADAEKMRYKAELETWKQRTAMANSVANAFPVHRKVPPEPAASATSDRPLDAEPVSASFPPTEPVCQAMNEQMPCSATTPFYHDPSVHGRPNVPSTSVNVGVGSMGRPSLTSLVSEGREYLRRYQQILEHEKMQLEKETEMLKTRMGLMPTMPINPCPSVAECSLPIGAGMEPSAQQQSTGYFGVADQAFCMAQTRMPNLPHAVNCAQFSNGNAAASFHQAQMSATSKPFQSSASIPNLDVMQESEMDHLQLPFTGMEQGMENLPTASDLVNFDMYQGMSTPPPAPEEHGVLDQMVPGQHVLADEGSLFHPFDCI